MALYVTREAWPIGRVTDFGAQLPQFSLCSSGLIRRHSTNTSEDLCCHVVRLPTVNVEAQVLGHDDQRQSRFGLGQRSIYR
jgi:hypothetical protein